MHRPARSAHPHRYTTKTKITGVHMTRRSRLCSCIIIMLCVPPTPGEPSGAVAQPLSGRSGGVSFMRGRQQASVKCCRRSCTKLCTWWFFFHQVYALRHNAALWLSQPALIPFPNGGRVVKYPRVGNRIRLFDQRRTRTIFDTILKRPADHPSLSTRV